MIQYPISNEISLRDVKYSADAECVIYSQAQTGMFYLMNEEI